MNDSHAYHQNRAAFLASIALEISRQNDPLREEEVREYIALAKSELAEIQGNDTEIPCPF